jgi:ABC-2 type transport system permease protein
MLRQVFAIVKKESRMLWRSKSDWAFLIAFPLVLTLIIGYVFGSLYTGGGGPIHVNVGIVNQDTSASPIPEVGNVSQQLIKEMNASEVFKPVYVYDNVSAAQEKLKVGDLDAVMVIKQNFTYNIVIVRQANMTVYVDTSTDPSRYQVVSSVIDTFTRDLTREITQGRIGVIKPYISTISVENQTFIIESMWAMSEPVGVSVVDTAVRKFRFVEWMLPGILGLEAIFGGLAFTTGIIASERERGHLRRMIVSPTSSWSILIGEMLSSLVRVSIAFLVVIGVNMLAFNVYDLNWAPSLTIPILILATLSSSALGLIISTISRRASTASSISSIATMVLQFLIGAYIPISMLGPIGSVASVLPWTMANEALRRVMINPLHGYETNVAPLIAYLAATTLALLAVGAFLYKVTNKRYI